jgi:hypothetical protein
MATGLANKLTSHIGEYLACAELGRRGFIATSFTGNVPGYDLLVCNAALQALPVQVKTSRGDNWPSRADLWLDIQIDHATKKQVNRGPRAIENPELIYICIALGTSSAGDRFFICEQSDIQKACIASYTRWMDPKGWVRPKKYESLDNRYYVEDLRQFENNWSLIEGRLSGRVVSTSAESAG